MIIDAHNHPDWHGHDLNKFLANMDQYGIDKTWLLSCETPGSEWDPATAYAFPPSSRPDQPAVAFELCLSYKQRAPERFILGYAPDPRIPGACDRLRAAKHIYGVQVCGEQKLRMMLDDWDAIEMYKVCAEEKLPVLVHIDYCFPQASPYPRPNWWYGGGIEAFERAVAACPDTMFVGHAPGFWAHISGDGKHLEKPYPTGPVVQGGKLPAMLDQYPNLFCDISAGSGHNALSRDLGFTKEFLLKYQDRILFGRDYFDNRHQELLRSLALPGEVLEKLFCGNAERILREYR